MEENERLSKHTSQLAIENQYLRQQQQQLVKSECLGKPSRRSQEQVCPSPYFFPDPLLKVLFYSPTSSGCVHTCFFRLLMLSRHPCMYPSLQLAMTTTDTSSESAVTGGLQQHPTPQHPPRDASPAG